MSSNGPIAESAADVDGKSAFECDAVVVQPYFGGRSAKGYCLTATQSPDDCLKWRGSLARPTLVGGLVEDEGAEVAGIHERPHAGVILSGERLSPEPLVMLGNVEITHFVTPSLAITSGHRDLVARTAYEKNTIERVDSHGSLIAASPYASRCPPREDR